MTDQYTHQLDQQFAEMEHQIYLARTKVEEALFLVLTISLMTFAVSVSVLIILLW